MLFAGEAMPSTRRPTDPRPEPSSAKPATNDGKGVGLKDLSWFPVMVLVGAGVCASILGGFRWIVGSFSDGELLWETLIVTVPWHFSFVLLPVALVIAGERRPLSLLVVPASWIFASIAAYPIYKYLNPGAAHGSLNPTIGGSVATLVNLFVLGAAALFMPALRKPVPVVAAAVAGFAGGVAFEVSYQSATWSLANSAAVGSSVVPLFALIGFGLARPECLDKGVQADTRPSRTKRVTAGGMNAWAGGLLVLLALITWFALSPLAAIGYGLCAAATAVVGRLNLVTATAKPRAAITAAAVAVTLLGGLLYAWILTNWLDLPLVSKNATDALIAFLAGGTSGWLYALWKGGRVP
jgi:hypothetical protein